MWVYWIPFVVAISFALVSIYVGIYSAEFEFLKGCASPICNSVRGFQWETMSAGLFGLSGGFIVLIATRQQLVAQARAQLVGKNEFLYDLNSTLAKVLQRNRRLGNKYFDQLMGGQRESIERACKISGDLFYELSYQLDFHVKKHEVDDAMPYIKDLVAHLRMHMKRLDLTRRVIPYATNNSDLDEKGVAHKIAVEQCVKAIREAHAELSTHLERIEDIYLP
jgi:hypothetical protein